MDNDNYGSSSTGEPDSSYTWASTYEATGGLANNTGACGSRSGDDYDDDMEDCLDSNSSYNPSGTDIAGDTGDQDCSGWLTCYEDADGDNFGSSAEGEDSSTSPAASGGFGATCSVPGWADDDDDCIDTEGYTFPGAAENESTSDCMRDQDEDGYGDDEGDSGLDLEPGRDCDDNDARAYPGVAYLEPTSASACMLDADGDGYGDDGATGAIFAGTDCDDEDTGINPSIRLDWFTDTGGDGLDDIDANCDGQDFQELRNSSSSVVQSYAWVDAPLGNATSEDSPVYFAATPGDVDGDGLTDLVLAAPYTQGTYTGTAFRERGTVYIISSVDAALVSGTVDPTDPTLAAQLRGSGNYGHLGTALTTIDPDGDGVSLVAAAAPHLSVYSGNRSGAVYLVDFASIAALNSASISSNAVSAAILAGDDIGDEFGTAMTSDGDVDGDGLSDLVVSAPYTDVGSYTNAGTVYVFSGQTLNTLVPGSVDASYVADATLDGEQDNHFFGNSLAAGDYDGDGYDDVLIGATGYDYTEPDTDTSDTIPPDTYYDAGEVRIAFGANPPSAMTLGASYFGRSDGDEYGYAVAAPNLDGDGYDEVCVSSLEDASGAGWVNCFAGTAAPSASAYADSAGYSLTLVSGDFGAALATLDDLDNDGRDELLIGAPEATGGLSLGEVYLFSEGPLGSRYIRYVDSTDSSLNLPGGLGYSIAPTGDFETSGSPGFAVGADDRADTGLTLELSTYLWSK